MIAYLVAGLVWIASLAGVGYWQHGEGVNDQKVADQTQFDKFNQEAADQKTKAAGLLATANAANLALMTERDMLKTKLEKEHAQAQAATAAARDRFANLSLRFQPAQVAGCRLGSGCAFGSAANRTSADVAAPVELPGALTASLRQLTFDADTLADAYRECYGYAQAVR